MAAKFEDGTVVQLKSGGPLMTIDTYYGDSDGIYLCKWFIDNKVQQGEFKEALLTEYKSEW